jgi:antitoxin (DNA-binding transcriptional repressor) of toxin-antitoxin stability system
MQTATIQEIQVNLPALLSQVGNGETIVILDEGKPVAELRPTESRTDQLHPRPFGLCAGRFTVPDDFDSPLPGVVFGKIFEVQ